MGENVFLTDFIGWAGMMLFVAANFMRRSNNIFYIQGAGNALYCGHVFLLGAMGGFAVCAIATLRSFLGAYYNNNVLKYIALGSIVSFFMCAILTGNTLEGYFSAFAASFLSLTLFYKDNTLIVRGLNLIANFMWIAFALVTASLPTLALYSVGVVTCVYGALKHEAQFAPLRHSLMKFKTEKSAV